jgi:hypothetical protein
MRIDKPKKNLPLLPAPGQTSGSDYTFDTGSMLRSAFSSREPETPDVIYQGPNNFPMLPAQINHFPRQAFPGSNYGPVKNFHESAPPVPAAMYDRSIAGSIGDRLVPQFGARSLNRGSIPNGPEVFDNPNLETMAGRLRDYNPQLTTMRFGEETTDTQVLNFSRGGQEYYLRQMPMTGMFMMGSSGSYHGGYMVRPTAGLKDGQMTIQSPADMIVQSMQHKQPLGWLGGEQGQSWTAYRHFASAPFEIAQARRIVTESGFANEKMQIASMLGPGWAAASGASVMHAPSVYPATFEMEKEKRLKTQAGQTSQLYSRIGKALPMGDEPVWFEGQGRASTMQKMTVAADLFAPDLPEGAGFVTPDLVAGHQVLDSVINKADLADPSSLQAMTYFGSGTALAGYNQGGKVRDLEKILGRSFGSYNAISVDNIIDQGESMRVQATGYSNQFNIKDMATKVMASPINSKYMPHDPSTGQNAQLWYQVTDPAQLRRRAYRMFQATGRESMASYLEQYAQGQDISAPLAEMRQTGKWTGDRTLMANAAMQWALENKASVQTRENVTVSPVAYEAMMKAGVPNWNIRGQQITAFDPASVTRNADGGYVIPQLTRPVFMGESLTQARAEFSRGRHTLRGDAMQMLADFRPDIYKSIQENYSPDDRARQMVLAAAGNRGLSDVAHASAVERYGSAPVDKALIADLIAQNAGQGDIGERVLKGYGERYGNQMIDIGEGQMLPSANALLSAMGNGKANTVGKRASNYLQMLGGGATDEALAEERKSVLSSLNKLAGSQGVLNRFVGRTLRTASNIGRGAAEVPDNQAVMSTSMMTRLMRQMEQYKDISAADVSRMADEGSLPPLTTMRYPAADVEGFAMTQQVKLFERMSPEFQEKYGPQKGYVLNSERVAQALQGDYDSDTLVSAITPGATVDTPERIRRLSEQHTESEFDKQVERHQRSSSLLDEAGKSQTMSATDFAKNMNEAEGIAKGTIGQRFNWLQRGMSRVMAQTAKDRGIAAPRDIGFLTLYGSQAALDRSAEGDPYLGELMKLQQTGRTVSNKGRNWLSYSSDPGKGKYTTFNSPLELAQFTMQQAASVGGNVYRNEKVDPRTARRNYAQQVLPGLVSAILPQDMAQDSEARFRATKALLRYQKTGELDESALTGGRGAMSWMFGTKENPEYASGIGGSTVGAMEARSVDKAGRMSSGIGGSHYYGKMVQGMRSVFGGGRGALTARGQTDRDLLQEAFAAPRDLEVMRDAFDGLSAPAHPSALQDVSDEELLKKHPDAINPSAAKIFELEDRMYNYGQEAKSFEQNTHSAIDLQNSAFRLRHPQAGNSFASQAKKILDYKDPVAEGMMQEYSETLNSIPVSSDEGKTIKSSGGSSIPPTGRSGSPAPPIGDFGGGGGGGGRTRGRRVTLQQVKTAQHFMGRLGSMTPEAIQQMAMESPTRMNRFISQYETTFNLLQGAREGQQMTGTGAELYGQEIAGHEADLMKQLGAIGPTMQTVTGSKVGGAVPSATGMGRRSLQAMSSDLDYLERYSSRIKELSESFKEGFEPTAKFVKEMQNFDKVITKVARASEKLEKAELAGATLSEGEAGALGRYRGLDQKVLETVSEQSRALKRGEWNAPEEGDVYTPSLFQVLSAKGKSGHRLRQEMTGKGGEYEWFGELPQFAQKLGVFGAQSANTSLTHMWMARQAWGLTGQSAFDAMGQWQQQQASQDALLMRSGQATYGDFMQGQYGRLVRREISGEERQLEFGRQVYNAYGGVGDLLVNGNNIRGNILGAAAGIGLPAAGLGIGAAALMGGPAGLAVGGAAAAFGAFGYASNASKNYDQMGRFMRGIDSGSDLFTGWLSNTEAMAGMTYAAFGNLFGAVSDEELEKVRNSPDFADVIDQYASGTINRNTAVGRSKELGFNAGDLLSYSQETFLRNAADRGITRERSSSMLSNWMRYQPDYLPSTDLFDQMAGVEAAGVDTFGLAQARTQAYGGSIYNTSAVINNAMGITSEYAQKAQQGVNIGLESEYERSIAGQAGAIVQNNRRRGLDFSPFNLFKTDLYRNNPQLIDWYASNASNATQYAITSPSFSQNIYSTTEQRINTMRDQGAARGDPRMYLQANRLEYQTQAMEGLWSRGSLYNTNMAANAGLFQQAADLGGDEFSRMMALANGDPLVLGEFSRNQWARQTAGVRQGSSQYNQLLNQSRGTIADPRLMTVNPNTGMSIFYQPAQSSAAGVDAMAALRRDQGNLLTGMSDSDLMLGTKGWEDRIRSISRGIEGYQYQMGKTQRAMDFAMTTGGTSAVDAQGFAVGGDGLKGLAGLYASQGMRLNRGNGMGMWQIQDAQERIQRSRQSYDMQQQEFDLNLKGRDRDLDARQFYEKWNLNYSQFQYGNQRTEQEMGIGNTQRLTRYAWQQQDIAMQQNQSDLQFGWQMEDFDRNIKYSRGRQRIDLMRQQERATISHGLEQVQRDRGKERADTQKSWDDEKFERDKRHHETTKKFGEEEMQMQKRHFEERRRLDDESFNRNKQRFEQEKVWMAQQWALEDQQRLISRQHTVVQHKMQEQIAAAVYGAQQAIHKYQDAIEATKRQQQETAAWIDVSTKNLNLFTMAMREISKVRPPQQSSGAGASGASGAVGHTGVNAAQLGVAQLDKMVELLQEIVDMGPGRVNATIYAPGAGGMSSRDMYNQAMTTVQ